MRFQIILFAMFAGLSAAWAQGTGDAIVVKFPGASLPSTVILATPGVSGVPGQALTIPVTLSLGGTTAPGSFQIDLSFDATQLTFVSAHAGGVLTGAGLGLSSSVVSTSDVHLATTGANQNGISGGVVAYAIFTLAASFTKAGTPVTLVSCMAADPLGNALSTGCTAGAIGLYTCDVTGDGKVGMADIQSLLNEALGVVAAVDDMNRDGVVNVADIQNVATAAMGRGCAY
jgi:hypothetical protein